MVHKYHKMNVISIFSVFIRSKSKIGTGKFGLGLLCMCIVYNYLVFVFGFQYFQKLYFADIFKIDISKYPGSSVALYHF